MAGEQVLVVDDSKESREFLISAVLKPNNFEAIQARDGAEGLEIARRAKPDLIILDYQMPRMDGRQVLEALRRENLNIPTILMTFHGSEDIAIEVFRLGVRDYVKKPYTVEEMLGAVNRSLTESRLVRERDELSARLMTANRGLNNRLRELNILYNFGRLVAEHPEGSQHAARVVETATLLTNAEQGILWQVQPAGIVVLASREAGETHGQPDSTPSIDSWAAKAITATSPVIMPPTFPHGYRLAVPIRFRGQAIGALGVERSTSGTAFSPQEQALLLTLADHVALILRASPDERPTIKDEL